MTTPDPIDASFRAALLASAATDGPPRDALDQELARLGLATVAGAAVAGAAGAGAAGAGAAVGVKAGGASLLSLATFAKIGLATIAIVGASSAYLALRDPAPTNASANANANASASASASASAGAEKVAAVSAITGAASEVAPPADAAPLRAADRPSTVVPPTPPGPPSFAAAGPASSTARDEAARTLAAEVALVDRARSLAHASPMRAIAVLDEHAQTFPTGALRDEAAVVRLEALLAAGLRSEAERHAQPFLRDRAHTPMARRMADLLGKTNAPIP